MKKYHVKITQLTDENTLEIQISSDSYSFEEATQLKSVLLFLNKKLDIEIISQVDLFILMLKDILNDMIKKGKEN